VITAKISLDSGGVLKHCEISGHSQAAPSGSDIICAAVSALVRTTLRVLAQNPDVSLEWTGPRRRGEAGFSAACKNEAGKTCLYHAGHFLTEGLKSIAEDYPENCLVEVERQP